ncbi:MAG: hypothetical protein CVU34_04180 [Betaproteobacteria bacterium HGW-Betaproteobacteria-7]|jgi:hypothetical protein|nr:MAG: hypothetical protein CVU34_04180 [Betaproteobacteria bacterium HGW-Betaproteobacteria-7]
MRIQESVVNLSSTHEATSSRHVEIETEVGFRQLFTSLAAEAPVLTEQATALRQRVQKMLESLIDAIMAAMDGRCCREKPAGGDPLPEAAEKPGRPAGELLWGRRISERVSESEATTVCGQGQVRTCDGREIAFDFSVAMQREYTRESVSEEGSMVRLRDPLVLSFAGNACELTGERIAFDLDADGSPEQIPGLAAGSCFLVFDRNGNGRADDGSELFGVASGDGFADLAKLDGDGNGWIDEGDAAFAQLALWSGGQWRSLAGQGVGALYTGSVAAPFALKDADNELLGQIRAAGVYLLESGQAGLMQQVDLAVSAPPTAEQQPGKGDQLAA